MTVLPRVSSTVAPKTATAGTVLVPSVVMAKSEGAATVEEVPVFGINQPVCFVREVLDIGQNNFVASVEWSLIGRWALLC